METTARRLGGGGREQDEQNCQGGCSKDWGNAREAGRGRATLVVFTRCRMVRVRRAGKAPGTVPVHRQQEREAGALSRQGGTRGRGCSERGSAAPLAAPQSQRHEWVRIGWALTTVGIGGVGLMLLQALQCWQKEREVDFLPLLLVVLLPTSIT